MLHPFDGQQLERRAEYVRLLSYFSNKFSATGYKTVDRELLYYIEFSFISEVERAPTKTRDASLCSALYEMSSAACFSGTNIFHYAPYFLTPPGDDLWRGGGSLVFLPEIRQTSTKPLSAL